MVEQWKDKPLSRPFNIPSSRSGSIKNNESEIILLKKKFKEAFGEGGDSVLTPAGVISMFGGAAAPSGWLLCNGAAVSREDYASLFEAISTAYGSGDGSTTFNVPDLQLKFARGAGSGSAVGEATTTNTHGHTVESGNHAHTHGISHTHGSGNYSGNTGNSGNHSHSTNTNTTGGGTSGLHSTILGPRVNRASGNFDTSGVNHTHSTPNHNHTINEGGSGDHSHNSNVGGNSGSSSNSNTGSASDTSHSHNSTTTAHIPAYVSVNYIIKI
jgi:microcystin-dependent protein